MLAALFILLPACVAAVWMFVRFVPLRAERRALRRFNAIALTIAAVLAATWTVRTYLVMTPTNDAAWWPIISGLGVLLIVPLVLGLAALFRSLVVFRR